jgi:hypothetical protein
MRPRPPGWRRQEKGLDTALRRGLPLAGTVWAGAVLTAAPGAGFTHHFAPPFARGSTTVAAALAPPALASFFDRDEGDEESGNRIHPPKAEERVGAKADQ